MHLELTTKFKTSQLPIEMMPPTPTPKFFAPTPAVRKKAMEAVPRNSTITGYEVMGTHFKVFYVHRAVSYCARMKVPRKNL